MNDLYPGLIDRPLVAKTYRPFGRWLEKSYQATRFSPGTLLIAFQPHPTHSLRNVVDYDDKIDFNETASAVGSTREKERRSRDSQVLAEFHFARHFGHFPRMAMGESHESLFPLNENYAAREQLGERRRDISRVETRRSTMLNSTIEKPLGRCGLVF